MLRIYECLIVDHDLRWVLVAAIVCTIGAHVSFSVANHATRAEKPLIWIGLAGFCAVATIWATHFIAILAYSRDIQIAYGLSQTVLSFLLGVIGVIAGFAVAISAIGRPARAVVGGVVIGLSIAVLHFVGMAALHVPGRLTYDIDLVVAAVLISASLGGVVGWVGFSRGGGVRVVGGALCLVAMTVGLHFTAMGAVHIELGLWPDEGPAGISRDILAMMVTFAVTAVLAVGVISALVDRSYAGRIEEQARRLQVLADSAFEGLIVACDGRVVDANLAMRRIRGAEDEDPTGVDLFEWIHPDERATARERILEAGPDRVVELKALRASGEVYDAEINFRPIVFRDGREGRVYAVRDVTARKRSEQTIRHLALYDQVTDLPNRRLFMEMAQKFIAQANRSETKFAVLNVNVDGFKLVNDVHGHRSGDALLEALGRRIEKTIRQSDVVARFGADEFAVLQAGTRQPEDAANLAARLQAAFEEPVQAGQSLVRVTASIGIAVFPDDGKSIDDLLRNADTALHRAKSDGGAGTRFFEAAMNIALQARRRLESRMRLTLERDGFEVFFQPQVQSDSGELSGFEALARWHDEELGFVSPGDFIPVAEDTGMIVQLGEQILRKSCREAAGWSRPLRVAVNLSAVQFRRERLADAVASALEDSGLPGDRLDLEITESILIQEKQQVLNTLRSLKSLGVHIAMDDFGTGYSSLSYLQSFPFDKLKIDQSFVSDLKDGEPEAAIIRAIVALGHSLGMVIVAEGVETAHQADLLRDLGCDKLQGYLISRPVPAAEVEELIAMRKVIRRLTVVSGESAM